MTDCGCKKDTGCACSTQNHKGDGGDISSLTAEDLARVNKIFGEMDLTSGQEEGPDQEMSTQDIQWLTEKFGSANGA